LNLNAVFVRPAVVRFFKCVLLIGAISGCSATNSSSTENHSSGPIVTQIESQDSNNSDAIEGFCDAVKAEASTIPTQVQIQILQCETQEGFSGQVLVVGLNDWLEWIDFSDDENTPDSEVLNEYIFDFPLQLVINGFRASSVSPVDYESVYIAFRDEMQTVYELNSIDAQNAVSDGRELKTVLQELREKIKISSL
jgi:hypothetical protein